MSDMMSKLKNLVYYKFIQPIINQQGNGIGITKFIGTDKKIAFYCSSEIYTGTEHHIFLLIEWLRERGLNVLLLTSSSSLIAHEAKEKNIEIVYVEPNIRYFDFKNARSVAALLRKLKVKILFIGTNRDIDIGSLIKSIFYRKLRLVYLQQMQLEFSKRDFFHTLRYRQYDAWVIPLSFLSKQVKSQTRYNIRKIHVIPYCVDVKPIQLNPMSQLEARHRLDLPPAARIIGIYGHIEPHKKQDLLIRTAKYLKSHNFDVDVLIMGIPGSEVGNEYFNFLVKMAKDYKLSERIHFRPFQTDENLFYRAIDIFAVITDDEASGLQTIKALANGTPIIALDAGGNKEILENETLGFLYRPNDFGDFSTKIMSLLTNHKVLKYLSEEGMTAALKKYDKSIECSKIEELINQLIK
jgi:glycosyltransferase involved in cell wall biosynthesis